MILNIIIFFVFNCYGFDRFNFCFRELLVSHSYTSVFILFLLHFIFEFVWFSLSLSLRHWERYRIPLPKGRVKELCPKVIQPRMLFFIFLPPNCLSCHRKIIWHQKLSLTFPSGAALVFYVVLPPISSTYINSLNLSPPVIYPSSGCGCQAYKGFLSHKQAYYSFSKFPYLIHNNWCTTYTQNSHEKAPSFLLTLYVRLSVC